MRNELLRRNADGGRKRELLQDSAQAVGASALCIAELLTLHGKETHADRDAFAVGVGAVMEVTLDGMTDGMAEIQHLPAAIVVLVFLYEFRLLQNAPQDDLLDILLQILLCLDGLEELEKLTVTDASVLHRFSQTIMHIAGRQGGEQIRIDEDALGLIKSARQILSASKVDSDLAADRAVDLRQNGGRDLEEINASHVGGSGKSPEIPRNAAGECHERIAS